MNSRKLQACTAFVIFLFIAKAYELLAGTSIDVWRVLCWSAVGIGSYIGLCSVFGFDPHRTRLGKLAPAMLHYVDRWELRLGQATLCMLGMIVVAARWLDSANFVTAVVSGTLSAWTYFALRLYVGSYSPARRLNT